MLVALLAITPLSWVTKSQGNYGVSLHDIKLQMAGSPLDNDGQVLLGDLWSMPPDDASESDKLIGLGGGITWAWDEALCDALLPRFREDVIFMSSMVDCNALKASVARAFNAWTSNNRHVKFVDVTEECKKR